MLFRLDIGRKFLIGVGGFVTLTVILLFIFIFRQSEKAITDQVDQQSRALLQQVVITRAWVADHGGVYLKKGPGVMENPYLPGTTVSDMKGNEYVFHNPAYVTRILSGYAERKEMYRFHITSLMPINPVNAPTPFEKKALEEFNRKGFDAVREGTSTVISEKGKRFYQRIIPLRVERPCLRCHAAQGYREGNIRGGLSVMIPMDLTEAQLKNKRILFGAAGIVIMAVVGLSLYIILRKVVLAPVAHLNRVASQLMAGDYSARAALDTGDELEGLGKAYNAMTNHIIESYQSMVKTLAAAIEARDPYTAGHVERVSRYATAIAEEMGVEPKLMHQIVMGAILHDIGKIGIPDIILQKPGSLDAEEAEKMRSHPVKGKDIISSVSDFTAPVQTAVLYHHEHFDGNGYPYGLKGEEIPIGDRIIAVADTFDAIVTDRPYRKGRTLETAIEEIKKMAGTQLDPEAVGAFIRVYEKGGIKMDGPL